MDCSSLESGSVGYVIFKLFCTRDRNPPSANDGNYYINTGSFQFPVWGGRLTPKSSDVFDESLVRGLPRVPCASLLVRVRAGPKGTDGISTISRDEFPKEEWVTTITTTSSLTIKSL